MLGYVFLFCAGTLGQLLTCIINSYDPTIISTRQTLMPATHLASAFLLLMQAMRRVCTSHPPYPAMSTHGCAFLLPLFSHDFVIYVCSPIIVTSGFELDLSNIPPVSIACWVWRMRVIDHRPSLNINTPLVQSPPMVVNFEPPLNLTPFNVSPAQLVIFTSR